jgi:porphobilinogen synthase
MPFPQQRLRRLRKNIKLRNLIQETKLSIEQAVMPYFVCHGKNIKKPISSMPGNYQLSIDNIKKEAKECAKLGIPAVLLFGLPAHKDEKGSEAYAKDGIVQQAVKAIKDTAPDLLVITGVCMCEYTSHGHCGIIKDGQVLNDPTIELLAQEALTHVQAGADMVAPSDMMDGRVGAIRKLLDSNGYIDIPIMAYSAKYASAFYSPFREAAESTPAFGDRKSYQMNPANSDEAMREIQLDLEEGADIIMVKPALPYLDIIYRAKQTFNVPIAAYNVSGEFSLVKAAAQKDWVDEKKVALEILLGIKRAGADILITYWAKDLAKWLAK